MQVQGISEKMADLISNKEIKKDVIRHLKYMQKNNIDILTIEDKNYPELLRQISSPPINIYVKGNKEILNKVSIGIVGCRVASDYGKNVAQNFAYNLAKNNINIVSGLARGIDSFSHIGAIKAKGITVGVIGNGLDMIYPKENIYLAQEILNSNGAIISECPLGTKPEKANFPKRNRIISGMSKGIIVVEAKEKSGTLLTVDFALEQGRDVYVVPGNINSINSIGTNELLKQGAKIITCYKDIIVN